MLEKVVKVMLKENEQEIKLTLKFAKMLIANIRILKSTLKRISRRRLKSGRGTLFCF